MKADAILTRSDAILRRVGVIMGRISGFLIIALSFLITAEVVSRFLFDQPIEGVIEIGALVLGMAIFLPQSHTLATGGHVKMTLVTERLSKRNQLLFQIIAYTFGLFLIGWLAYYGWSYFWQSFVIRERMGAMIPIPWWAGKFAVPAGFLLFALQYLTIILLSVISYIRGEAKLEQAKEGD